MSVIKSTEFSNTTGWCTACLKELVRCSWGNTSLTKKAYRPEGFTAFSASGPDGFVEAFENEGPGIVLSAIGARCGRCFQADGRWTAIKNTITFTEPQEGVTDIRFLFFFLNRDGVWPKRGAGQPFIGLNAARDLEVPVPPLNEQRRIVAKIEELTARTTRAKEALDAIPPLLERFRQSVLAAAFRGDLTKQWRQQNPNTEPASELLKRDFKIPSDYKRLTKMKSRDVVTVPERVFPEIPASWSYQTIQHLYDKKILIDFADGNHGSLYPRKSEFGDDGVLFVTAAQIDGGRIEWSSVPKLNEKKANQLRKGWAKAGDVLLTHNATVGRVALVELDRDDFLLGTSATFYRLNPNGVLPPYLFYFFTGPIWQAQLSALMSQTTRNQVSIQKQAFFRVAVPPIAEQREIVRLLDSYLPFIEHVEEQQNQGTSKLNHLSQSILAKAFRGELVPQDPNDEPASALLERIQANGKKK